MTRSPELDAALARADATARAAGWDGATLDHAVVELLALPELRELLRAVELDVTAFAEHLTSHVASPGPEASSEVASVEQFLARLEQRRTGGVEPALTPRVALGRMLMRHRRFATVMRAYHLEPVDILYALAHGAARRRDTHAPPPRAWLPRVRRPRRAARLGSYRVFVHDDDFTTFAVVHEALVDWFDLQRDDATELTHVVHATGRGVVGVFALDDAARRIDEASRVAHDQGYPLRFSFEPAEPEDASAAVP